MTQASVVGGTDCNVVVRDVNCDLGAIVPGASVDVQVSAILSPAWTETVALPNTATVQAITADRDPSNNSATAQVTPTAPQADVSVEKRVVGAVSAGSLIAYEILVKNNGPSRAYGVTLEDTLPAADWGWSADISYPADGCEITGATLSCDIGELALDGTTRVMVHGTVPASWTGDIVNTATVTTTSSTDPQPSNNESQVTSTPERVTDLAVMKTADRFIANSTGTYTITVSNAGPADAFGVSIVDTLPDGLPPVLASLPADCTVSGQIVTCTNLEIPSGGTVTRQIQIEVPDGFVIDTTVVNTVTVTPGPEQTDPDPSDNEASHTAETDALADIWVTKTGPGTIAAGSPGDWVITIGNSGPSQAQNVTFNDVMPPNIAVNSVTVMKNGVPMSGACPFPIPAGPFGCEFGTLLKDDLVTVTVNATPNAYFADDAITNIARIATSTPETTTSNNQSTVITQVVTEADVQVTKTGPTTAQAGETITWHLEVTNHGPSSAQTVTFDDHLPTWVTIDPTVLPPNCALTGPYVFECDLGTLAPGETKSLDLSGQIKPYTPHGEVLTNRAAIFSPTPDPQHDNNVSETDTTVTQTADLSVQKVVDPDPLVEGGTAQYQITVTNDGPSTAFDVTITDSLPNELEFITVQGPGDCTYDDTDHKIVCAVPSIAPGSSGGVTIDVVVAVVGSGSVQNTVEVATSTPDPAPGNNVHTINTPVISLADLVLTKTADRSDVFAGEAVTYTLEVQNFGPSTAQNVVVSDVVPAGMEFVAADDDCAFDASTGTITCNTAVLGVGETWVIHGTLKVPADSTLTEFTNTASVGSDVTDPDTSDNDSSVTVNASVSADVSVTKLVTPGAARPGEEVTWLIGVQNAGPSVARDVVVTDEVPSMLEIASVGLENGGSCVISGQTLTCEMGNLDVGLTTVKLVTKVRDGVLDDQIANTVTVATSSPDADPSNNEAQASLTVTQIADLGIDIDVVGEVTPGETLTVTVSGKNIGPSPAVGSTVAMVLPPGLADIHFSATGPNGVAPCELLPPATESEGGEELPPSSGTLVCDFGTVVKDGEFEIVMSATVTSDAPATLEFMAHAGSQTPDADASNNDATATVAVKPAPPVDEPGAPGAPGTGKPGTDAPGGLQETGASSPLMPALFAVLLASLGVLFVTSRRLRQGTGH